MRRLVVSEWVTLDGVFDAARMGEWFARMTAPTGRTGSEEGSSAPTPRDDVVGRFPLTRRVPVPATGYRLARHER